VKKLKSVWKNKKWGKNKKLCEKIEKCVKKIQKCVKKNKNV